MGIKTKMFELFVGWERFQARLKRKSLVTDEGEIAYLEGGDGPTLVLLHGFGADKDSWNRLAKNLTRYFHVVAIDIPGFGESFSPVAGFDIDKQVVRVTAFLKQKNICNFTVLGNSYGGYISALLASRFPDVIKNCILISPLGIENAPLTPMFKDVVNGCSPLLLPTNLNEFKRLLKACFYKAPFIPEFALKAMLERNLAKSTLHHKLFYQTHLLTNGQLSFDYALEELLTEVKIPIHVIWGDSDAILSGESLKVLLGLDNKLITLECLENVGHLPQLEVPNYLSNLVIETVQSIMISRI
jgi:pimeloyl-ACP methyl ester carboxylesterase